MLPPVFNNVAKKRKGIRLAIREDAYMGAKESMIYFMHRWRLVDYLKRNPSKNNKVYDLDGQDLRDLDFRGLDLRRASLKRAVLHRVDFRGANLRGVDITGADLTGANITKDQLKSTTGRPAYGPEGPLTAAKIYTLRPLKH